MEYQNQEILDEGFSSNNFSEDNESTRFINDIMNDDYLPEEAKEIFYEEFAQRYLSERKFQNDNFEKYILFFNKKYYGIFNSVKDAERLGGEGDDRYLYRIGGYRRKKMYANSKYIPLQKINKSYEPYKVNLKIYVGNV